MNRLTYHIQERMIERDICFEELIEIIDERVDTVTYPSDRDPDVNLIFGKVSKKYILLVYNRLTDKYITVRKMRPKEKRAFEEAIKDERRH